MDSHSFSGFNAPSSSFLQELTVEDPSKDVYTGTQVPQQRPYQSYQDPNSGCYSSVPDIPTGPYFNGQYNADPYYLNHPVYTQRVKYPETTYTATPPMPSHPSPHSQVTPKSVVAPSPSPSAWVESQQPPQYQSDSYTSQPTFQSGSRVPAGTSPSSHVSSVTGSSIQQPYQSSVGHSFNVVSGSYCPSEMAPVTYPSVPPPQQSIHPMSVNGETLNPYAQHQHQPRNPAVGSHQPPTKAIKRQSRARSGPGVKSQSAGSYIQSSNEPAALERFAAEQCPPNVTVITPNNELPHSTILNSQVGPTGGQPTVLPAAEGPPRICNRSNCESPAALIPIHERDASQPQRSLVPSFSETATTRGESSSVVKSPESVSTSVQPSNSSTQPATQLSPCLNSTQSADASIALQPGACSPRPEQVSDGSPQPPSLKSPIPIRSPPPGTASLSSSNDNLPPILPNETLEEERGEELDRTGTLCDAVAPVLSSPYSESVTTPQKRSRGRKRKLEERHQQQSNSEDVHSVPAKTERKRPSKADVAAKRKASLAMANAAKRSRRKATAAKLTSKNDVDLDGDDGDDDDEDDSNSRLTGIRPSTMLEGDDDEDTMAASATATEADEESTTATTLDEASEMLPKRPRPPPRLRAPRPKKKRALKTLMKKKRRGAYHYGDESDGSESDDEGAGGGRSSRVGLHPVASTQSLHSQLTDENSLDSSARRSGRRAGDRKKYTIDNVDFGLSDEGDGEGADSADISDSETVDGSRKRSDADFVDVKVVEKILGRRMSTRPTKKPKSAKSIVTSKKPQLVSPELVDQQTSRVEMADPLGDNPSDCDAVIVQGEKEGPHSELPVANPVGVNEEKEEEEQEEEEEEEQVEEFYLKYKGFSYMHCEWKAFDEIADPRIATKMKKFFAKNGTDPLPPPAAEDDDGTTVLFNPDYVEVDRVLDVRIYDRLSGDIVTEEILNPEGTPRRSQQLQKGKRRRGRPPRTRPQDESAEDEMTATPETADSETQDESSAMDDGQPATVTYYLVKWRSLPYEDSTWELAEDVDPAKVKEFMRIRNPPKNPPIIRDSNHKIIRPDPSVWRPIAEDEVYRNDNRLREYQVEGVNWLSFCWYNKRNCILADEMGLGKTVQSIAFLLEVIKAGVSGPFLIIVPLSTVGNWQREFENWSDLNAIVYHGSAVSRSMIQEYELFYHRRKTGGSSTSGLGVSQHRHDVYKFNALITTFEVLMSDIEFFGRMHWAVAIIDEAHRLKNKKCKLGEGLRYLDLDHRVLLTGTPLQNNVEELFGLLNFLEPERFACANTFLAEFGELKTEQQVEDLKTLLKPMMLRRLKEDVEKSLAPKEETIIEVELTNLQKKYYRAIMERNFTFLCKGTTGSNMPNLMNVMMELRKCCNHPFLIKGAEDAILNEQRTLAKVDPSKPYNEEQQMFSALLNASGKLVLIHKLLPKLKAGGHKVLIFSQMIRVLDILEDYLVYQGFSFERIDGRIHGLLRQEAIDRFCNDPDKFVFLLCTKAGGLGINLTAADVVIIYDSDWNPQNDLQAQARCHRIGQQKMVKVYRLITRNTYEREMFDRASLKLGLDKAVLQSTGAHARQAQLSKKEVEELLKKGAYGALMDDDKAGDDFCEEDIDQILQSRSHVVQLEQGEKNSTFSKATFSISDNRNDIALDDPDFWQKWAKKAGVEEAGLEFEDLIMTTPRQRRQTHRYTAELNEQQSNSGLSHSQSNSRLPNGGNTCGAAGGAGSNPESSDGENSSGESSGPDDDGGDSRASGTTTNTGTAKTKSKKSKKSRRNEEAIGGAIDRVDLFRVEKCLFTWSWGRWAHAIDCIPFKRPICELEMQRIASSILGYALKVTPSLTGGGDARIRAVVLEMVNCNKSDGTELSLRTMADVVQALKASASEVTVRGGGRRGRRGVTRGGADSPMAPSTPTTPTTLAFDTDPTDHALKPDDISHDVAKKEEDDQGGDFGITSDSFKRHLTRAGGRLLARVYTLYFLHTEIVGLEHADALCDGSVDHTAFTQLAESLPPLKALDADVPADWWDSCCDKCLLLGVFKHGWEKYLAIRDDPAFCFYHRVYGPSAPAIPIPTTKGGLKVAMDDAKPDNDDAEEGPSIKPEEPGEDAEMEDEEEERSLIIAAGVGDETGYAHTAESAPKLEANAPSAGAGRVKTEPLDVKPRIDETNALHEADADEMAPTPVVDVPPSMPQLDVAAAELPPPLLLFPAVVDLNSRMRKLIAYFQRVRAQVELEAVHNLRTETIPNVTAQPYMEQRLIKWSRREEADFYRVVSSFGVEQVMRTPHSSPSSAKRPAKIFAGYNWATFKLLANLSKKPDQAITEYYNAFLTMCHRVCRESLPEGLPPPVCSLPTTTTYGSCPADEEIPIAPISEERATRTLSRIKLLNRIRSYILSHDRLEERLALCQRSSDLPEWWIPGRHDGELLRAAAKHGLARTDLNILPDKEFSFSRVAALIQRQLLKNPSALNGVVPPTISAVEASSSATATPLSLSEVEARASMATAASLAARAVAAELEAKIASQSSKAHDPADGNRGDAEDAQTKPEVVSSENGGSDLNEGQSLPVAHLNSEHFTWSLKFATNLAIAWPKDRTIHNRLDMVCQCIETGHWPLPRRYILNNVEDQMGRYVVSESTGGGSRDASPAAPSSPDLSTQKKPITSTDAATLAALSAAGYTNIDQVLALQAAAAAVTAAASAHQPEVGASLTPGTTRGGRGGGRGSRGGRGRGRGSRGGGGGYSREDFASAASLASVAKNAASPLPTRGRGSRGGQMLPPRGSPGSTRGRKRKFETNENRTSLPPPDSSAWEVNVPLISLVNGSLIHGEKAPKRRHLEAWLEAHPDYMPYSVEPEDQVIFNRVAKARGQDTSAMEALAYRHYMTSLLSKAANYATSQRTSSASDLMEQQQKQLLAFAAATAYSSNPAYASMLASALGYSQAAASQQKSVESESSQNEASTSQMSSSAKSSSDALSSVSRSEEQGKRSGAAESPSLPPSTSTSASGSQLTPESLHSMLAAYQQAASFVAAAYMYNPSLYSQHFGGPSASTASDALQRQQLAGNMSNLLSSVFAAASAVAANNPSTSASAAPLQQQMQPKPQPTEAALDLPASSPPPSKREERETSGEAENQSTVEDASGGGGGAGGGDSDVLDLSKPE
uniref:Chromo domain-containing protein n=1 Tax=Mesocestoides corti TaxID=53468 RepID=A0A5K3F821_MESCO